MSAFCDICEKTYSSPASLYVHKKKYHGNDKNRTTPTPGRKPPMRKCKFCKKEFSSNSNMHRHMRTCKHVLDDIKPAPKKERKDDEDNNKPKPQINILISVKNQY